MLIKIFFCSHVYLSENMKCVTIIKQRMMRFKDYLCAKIKPELIQTLEGMSVLSKEYLSALALIKYQPARNSTLIDMLLHTEDEQLLYLFQQLDLVKQFPGSNILFGKI